MQKTQRLFWSNPRYDLDICNRRIMVIMDPSKTFEKPLEVVEYYYWPVDNVYYDVNGYLTLDVHRDVSSSRLDIMKKREESIEVFKDGLLIKVYYDGDFERNEELDTIEEWLIPY